MEDTQGMGQPNTQPTEEAAVEPQTEADDRKNLEHMREELRVRRIGLLKAIDPALPANVETWKANHGLIDSQHILSTLYIWRGMNRSEYIALMNVSGDKWKNEESIVSKCLLHPPIRTMDWVVMPAGLPTTLSELILGSSGFGADDPMPVRL